MSSVTETECSVERCPRMVAHRGWCELHYNRWHRTGEPGGAELQFGERDHHWSGAFISYTGMHQRVARQRGKAKEHACAHCSGIAAHWAYDHRDDDERTEDGKPFSLDISHYLPLCVGCHTVFDRKREFAQPVQRAPHNRAKTHCPQGHSYDEGNTARRLKTEHRVCKQCNRDRARANYHRKREAS